MLNLFVMRHGETTLSHTLRGWTDDPLTEKGWQQMQTTFNQAWQQQHFDAIVASDLQRCAIFAKEIANTYQLPLRIVPELREMNFGDWEAQSVQTLFQINADIVTKFWQTPTQYTPANAESLFDFSQRIDRALKLIQTFAQQQQVNQLLVITHGGVIKYLYIQEQKENLDKILTMPAELGTLHQFILKDNQIFLK